MFCQILFWEWGGGGGGGGNDINLMSAEFPAHNPREGVLQYGKIDRIC